MSIAHTILNQIKTIDPRATWAWGAKELVAMADGLKFKTSGAVKWKGYVYVKYNQGNDLYDIQFFRLRNFKIVNDKQYNDIYAEDLVKIIDTVVG
jgi:hypothetical protein